MGRHTLVDDEVWVHYGQVYVQSEFDGPGLREAFAGQANGLCGAAAPGGLFLITGLHTGRVGFVVELIDEAPALNDAWEDVVEVSFTPESTDVTLMCWGGQHSWPLDLQQESYRVRYSATAMDRAHAIDTQPTGEPVIDRYLLQFWRAPVAADRIVKQTSATAAYWHKHAQRLPPPPPPPTPEELAEAERRAVLERKERQRRFEDRVYWGGRPPSDRLRQIGGTGLADLDRDLVDAIAEASPVVHRGIARWAARRAYEAAGLADLDWAAAGLNALERGEPLPAPFDNLSEAFEVMSNDVRVVRTLVSLT